MKNKKSITKSVLVVAICLLVSICSNAQTTQKKVITDVLTGLSYNTEVTTDASTGGVTFAMDPHEQVATPSTPPNQRVYQAGPRAETSYYMTRDGEEYWVMIRVCGNTMVWPCSWCANSAQ